MCYKCVINAAKEKQCGGQYYAIDEGDISYLIVITNQSRTVIDNNAQYIC